jgi:hypothetical protein
VLPACGVGFGARKRKLALSRRKAYPFWSLLGHISVGGSRSRFRLSVPFSGERLSFRLLGMDLLKSFSSRLPLPGVTPSLRNGSFCGNRVGQEKLHTCKLLSSIIAIISIAIYSS